jgi:translation initiation factor 2 alpha subunit (eIF-2alpha)
LQQLKKNPIKQMKLVDPSGKEVTSKENKNAKELETQLHKQIEKLLEPIFNKIKLSGAQVPQEQLMQLSSAAHQMLFNRMIYNLLLKVGVKEISEVLSEDDVEELQTSLSNQLQIVNPSEMDGPKNGPNKG